MNSTNFEHAGIAVGIQVVLLILFAVFGHSPGELFAVLAASLPGPFAFFGREQSGIYHPPAHCRPTVLELRE